VGYFWKQQDDIPEGMGYLIGYATLTLSVILLMYLVIVLVKKSLANR
jgi:hypothetical protein